MSRFNIRTYESNYKSVDAGVVWRFVDEKLNASQKRVDKEEITLGSFMVIENLDTHNILEVAYNLKGACTLFHNPDSHLEDMMIAHNGNAGERDSGEYIEFKMDDGRDATKRVYSYHLVKPAQALIGIKTFIESHELDNRIGWHAY